MSFSSSQYPAKKISHNSRLYRMKSKLIWLPCKDLHAYHGLPLLSLWVVHSGYWVNVLNISPSAPFLTLPLPRTPLSLPSGHPNPTHLTESVTSINHSDHYHLRIPAILTSCTTPLHSALYWYYAFIIKLSLPLYYKFLKAKNYILYFFIFSTSLYTMPGT